MNNTTTKATQNTTEEWRDVIGFEGYYQVSNIGRVKRLAGSPSTSRDRIKKQHHNTHGYPSVGLCVGGKNKTIATHKLVANAFLCPRPSCHVINHKDGNKDNNLVSNLEWVTPTENTQHRFRTLKKNVPMGEQHCRSKVTREDVLIIRECYATGAMSMKSLGEWFGLSNATVFSIIHRQSWKHI